MSVSSRAGKTVELILGAILMFLASLIFGLMFIVEEPFEDIAGFSAWKVGLMIIVLSPFIGVLYVKEGGEIIGKSETKNKRREAELEVVGHA